MANALFYAILTEVSVGRISIEILMPGLWIVDIEDDWKGLRMHNFWSWQPACQLLYWIMDLISFSARRVKKPTDKGEVSRPNEIRENPCSAEWKIQNRTNMHYKFLLWISFQVLEARDIQEATKYYFCFGNCPPQTNYCSVHARSLIILPTIEERTFPRKVWPL